MDQRLILLKCSFVFMHSQQVPIAGYIPNLFKMIMLAIASIIYVSFVWCIRFYKPFFPQPCVHFSFVISAIAYRQTSACLADFGQPPVA